MSADRFAGSGEPRWEPFRVTLDTQITDPEISTLLHQDRGEPLRVAFDRINRGRLVGPLGAGSFAEYRSSGHRKLEHQRPGDSLVIGEVYALWVQAQHDLADRLWSEGIDACLARNIRGELPDGEAFRAEADKVDRAWQRRRNMATKRAYGITFTEFCALLDRSH